MPSTYVIAIAIAALLIILIAYALIAQHAAKKRKHRQRLVSALKAREQMFKSFAEGFPPGFLTPELQSLIYRVLLNISEQLHKLEPRGGHIANINLYTGALAQKIATNQNITFETPEQINQIRGLLQELGRYISSQTEQGRITKPQAHGLINQIKGLILQITLDNAMSEAQKAETEGKASLALHRYKQCLTLLQKNQQSPAHKATALKIAEIVTRLTEEVAAAAISQEEEDPWNEVESEKEDWKKKQVYD